VQVPGSRFLQGDFTTNETKAAMRKMLGGAPVDLRVESAIRGCATAQ
jgi:23S rRNA U2552 (ribose-2'-O)-methylase RlmE/FtsJ